MQRSQQTIGNIKRISIATASAFVAIASVLPTTAFAQSSSSDWAAGNWQYRLSLNGWLPTLGGKTTFPADGGASISVDPAKIIDALKFAFMGTFDAHNGRYGAFTDILYVNLGASKSQTRDFSFGGVGLPADTTADLRLDVKTTVWTLAGEYRVSSDSTSTTDVLVGARMLSGNEKLGWSISGSLGPISPTGRSGSQEVSATLWDAIVGVKGRMTFGQNREWLLPYYADVGTGASKVTWQAAGGVGYAFRWGEVNAVWRYLDYKMKSGKAIEELNMNGPMISVTMRF